MHPNPEIAALEERLAERTSAYFDKLFDFHLVRLAHEGLPVAPAPETEEDMKK